LLSSALVDYQTVTSRIADLGLFSPNESFQEISARNAIYLFSFYCWGDLQLQARTIEPEDRMISIQKATVRHLLLSELCQYLHVEKVALKRFRELLDDYGVISAEHRKLYSNPLPADAYKRRETKIAQHRSKKELHSLVEVCDRHFSWSDDS
jgi:immunoglobulin-binding protein 1